MRRTARRASLSMTARGGDVSLKACASAGEERESAEWAGIADATATDGSAVDPVSFPVGVS